VKPKGSTTYEAGKHEQYRVSWTPMLAVVERSVAGSWFTVAQAQTPQILREVLRAGGVSDSTSEGLVLQLPPWWGRPAAERALAAVASIQATLWPDGDASHESGGEELGRILNVMHEEGFGPEETA
jgi:hypothetical protein